MASNIRTEIVKINHNCDNLEFVLARKLIEQNLTKLSEATYFRLLNSNARTLIKIVVDEKNNTKEDALTRLNYLTISNINEFSRNFDISMLKRTLKDNMALIQREDVQQILSKDAKIVLESLGAIIIGYKEVV